MNNNRKHGEVYQNIRHCNVHGSHGILYPCPCYDKETLREIKKSTRKVHRSFKMKWWRRRQIKNGIPPIVIDTYKKLYFGDV